MASPCGFRVWMQKSLGMNIASLLGQRSHRTHPDLRQETETPPLKESATSVRICTLCKAHIGLPNRHVRHRTLRMVGPRSSSNILDLSLSPLDSAGLSCTWVQDAFPLGNSKMVLSTLDIRAQTRPPACILLETGSGWPCCVTLSQ